MRACGGGSRRLVWRKIMAALYQCNICTLQQEEGPAYGAEILAGAGTGVFSSIQDACDRFIKEKDTLAYSHEEAETYRKYHAVYDRMCESLRADFATLAKL